MKAESVSAFALQAFLLPEGFPQTASVPKFQLGDRVRFVLMPAEDYGIVTRLQYVPAEHLQNWAWGATYSGLIPSRIALSSQL